MKIQETNKKKVLDVFPFVSLANSPKSDNFYFEWDKMQTSFHLEYQNILRGIDSFKVLNRCENDNRINYLSHLHLLIRVCQKIPLSWNRDNRVRTAACLKP